MGQKPFEVAAECAMPGLPAGADIERVSEQLEHARRRSPGVVRTAVQAPVMFKDRAYVLETRFVVWAEDGEQAVQTVWNMLDGAKIPHRSIYLSGRALAEADAPRPAVAPTAAPARARPSRPAPAKGRGKARAAKPARARQRSGARTRTAPSRKPARGRNARGPKQPAGRRRRR
jgi:hypothetical protein